MKKTVFCLMGGVLLGQAAAHAKGLWRERSEIDPPSANRYACAKFLKHALSHPQPEGITEDSRPIYSEEALVVIKGLSQKQHKWFERRSVHQRLKDDQTQQGDLYRTHLPRLYFSRSELPLPGAINCVSQIAGHMLGHKISFDIQAITRVFEDWEKNGQPSMAEWDAQGMARLFGLWRVWNWEPER